MQPGECDSDWRLAATPLELSHPVTAINFAMVPVSDNRYMISHAVHVTESYGLSLQIFSSHGIGEW